MKQSLLDKFAAVGSLLAAAACPACFPLFGVVGTAIGLGIFKPFEGIVFYVFQLFVAVGIVGNISAYLNHRRIIPLVIGVGSPGLVFLALYGSHSSRVLYAGLLGMSVAALFNFFALKRCEIKRTSRE